MIMITLQSSKDEAPTSVSAIVLISFCVEALSCSVYIEKNESPVYHHTRSCKEIRNSDNGLREVSLKEAEEVHKKKPCGRCC
jgi:hypothetical protein